FRVKLCLSIRASTAEYLLDHYFYVVPLAHSNTDWLTFCQVRLQDRRAHPLQVPAILERNDRVLARQHVLQSEGSITVALVAPHQRGIVFDITRHQYNHRASERLAVAQCRSIHAAYSLRNREF